MSGTEPFALKRPAASVTNFRKLLSLAARPAALSTSTVSTSSIGFGSAFSSDCHGNWLPVLGSLSRFRRSNVMRSATLSGSLDDGAWLSSASAWPSTRMSPSASRLPASTSMRSPRLSTFALPVSTLVPPPEPTRSWRMSMSGLFVVAGCVSAACSASWLGAAVSQ